MRLTRPSSLEQSETRTQIAPATRRMLTAAGASLFSPAVTAELAAQKKGGRKASGIVNWPGGSRRKGVLVLDDVL